MVLPVAVDGAQAHAAFEVLEDLRRFVLFAAGLQGADAVGGEQEHLRLRAREDVLEVEAHVERGHIPVDEGFRGAAVGGAVPFGEDHREAFLDLFLDDVHDRRAAVLGLERAVTQAVDDLTLLVQHVVVLEQALAHGV